VKRDIRQIIKVYSPYGYIYVPPEPNRDPDYLLIRDEHIFKKEAGSVELVYDIHEGKPFKLGRILVKGNSRVQDKVIEREIRVTPASSTTRTKCSALTSASAPSVSSPASP